MHEIPTPMQVLKQQANGERVVTLFLNKSELLSKHVSKLNYMAGEIEHPRDALEFLLHDLKHMEHFINEEIYEEQGIITHHHHHYCYYYCCCYYYYYYCYYYYYYQLVILKL
jgi:hypothetical protein